MENTESHMENTESDVREKYGKHGVIWKTRSPPSMENTESDVKKYGKHGVRRVVNVKYGKQ
jgi:hypothetical protein